jgi:hypothetical protein
MHGRPAGESLAVAISQRLIADWNAHAVVLLYRRKY